MVGLRRRRSPDGPSAAGARPTGTIDRSQGREKAVFMPCTFDLTLLSRIVIMEIETVQNPIYIDALASYKMCTHRLLSPRAYHTVFTPS